MKHQSKTNGLIVALAFLCLLCGFFGKQEGEGRAYRVAETAVENVMIDIELTPAATPEPALIPAAVLTPAPTPEPAPEPTPMPPAEPVSGQEEKPAAESVPGPTPFSMVWLTDTQNVTRDDRKEVFLSMRDWILDNREEKNIVFMAHTGDVVDAPSQGMWDNASEALLPILDVMPGAICSGNHDVADKHLWYNTFLNREYVQAALQNDDFFQENVCYYTSFEAGGDTFLVFAMGYKASSPGCFRWAEKVMDEHPGAIAIFLSHYAMESDKKICGAGKHFLKLPSEGYPQAKLMLCGHMRGNAFYRDADTGSVVMMYNYQDDFVNGAGYLRLLTFHPDTRDIEVTTYSPWLDLTGYKKTTIERDCFTIENGY